MSDGILALLELPRGTSLSFNGKPIALVRDDFVGFSDIPSHCFHLATVQNSSNNQAPRHGFLLLAETDLAWMVARRYDPLTEEVDAKPIDTISEHNLETACRSSQLTPERMVPWTKALDNTERQEWTQATSFITTELLRKRKVSHGDKIVPGSYHEDDCEVSQVIKNIVPVDGLPLDYPPIPILSESQQHPRCKHAGTKRFLSKLSPCQRTRLAMDGPSAVLQYVIEMFYDNSWQHLLGDVQLAHSIFLNLHCFSSLEHWRDLITMISLIDTIDEHYVDLYLNLTIIVQHQMKSMDKDFFEDMEFSGGNFFLPAITRLVRTLHESKYELLQQKAVSLRNTASTLFPVDDDSQHEQVSKYSDQNAVIGSINLDDTDEPVVVSQEEYLASLARPTPVINSTNYLLEDCRRRYPLLVGFMQPGEDILMVCARILDTCPDVSLVREAAAYLQEVEAHKR